MIPLIDGHLDIAMNALMYKRDQKLSIAQIRGRETAEITAIRGTATVSFPELRAAKVSLFVGTVIARAKPDKVTGDYDWPSQDMAHSVAMGQLAGRASHHHRPHVPG